MTTKQSTLLERAKQAEKALRDASAEMEKLESELLVAWLSAFAVRQKAKMTKESEIETVRDVLKHVAKVSKSANKGKTTTDCSATYGSDAIKNILSQVYDYSGTMFEFTLTFKEEKE